MPGKVEEIEPEALKEWRKYSDLYKGFIRPLVSSCKVYHHAPVNGREGWDAGSWLAMEFMAPDRRKGWALVVRYPEDRSSTFSFRARGLEAEALYRVAFDNSGRSEHHTGSDLMRTGLSLNLAAEPASELLLFEALE